ncbi:MAG: TRAP transporter permease [Egibacteraceae bacterium]
MDGVEGVGDQLADLDAEKPARVLSGVPAKVVAVAGIGLSAAALWWVFRPLPALQYRSGFLAVALAMTFLVYRARRGATERPTVVDWALAGLALAALAYPVVTFDEFARRAVRPTPVDLLAGVFTAGLVLEATRRTVGWALPAICIAFLAYAFGGDLIPAGYLLGHRGYDLSRVIGQTYIGIEGIFGVPLDVAATYIVLFTLYGAVLDHSGAGRFFIDLSLAAFGRSSAGPGRTVTLAGFLLGTVSGSGVATTVTLGSVAWPILRRSGYPPAEGGGVLAAAGIGAILSPPTLGAAAFIIAELLGVSYLRVLGYAMIPTLLYYLGIILAIQIDARRHLTTAVGRRVPCAPPLGRLLLRYGYHFSSLLLIVALMAAGLSPFRAVTYAIGAAVALSFLDPAARMTPRRLRESLAAGARSVLPVAATCAAAGIIVGVVTLTGLGLKLSSIIVALASSRLWLTALYSAIAVLVLGLAVPVTASFIIAAVIVGPALTSLGVEPFAAFMFIFYFAVLSEVTPPTALSAVAAAAITGANAFRTMMATWRYSLPAFLVPFSFVLSPNGEGILLQAPPVAVLLALAASAAAVAALAAATGGWLLGPAGWAERCLAIAAALLLLTLEPVPAAAGLGALAVAFAIQAVRPSRERDLA